MLSKRTVDALRRILASPDNRFPVTNAMRDFTTNYNVGRAVGKSISFTNGDKTVIREMLMAGGYATEVTNSAPLPRAENLEICPSEKSGALGPKRNRISIKALNGRELRIGSDILALPPRVHLDVDWTTISASIGHRSVMLVENYENFDRIHETIFSLPPPLDDPLVLYRGDPFESRQDNVMAFLRASGLPVMAFFDVDPQGLAMAAVLPNLAAFVAPSIDTIGDLLLEKKAENKRILQPGLYQQQYAQAGISLDQLAPTHPCARLWCFVQSQRAGIAQEWWIGRRIMCEAMCWNK